MGHGTCSCCDELATIKADLESHKAASVGELYTRLRDGQKQMCERAERAESKYQSTYEIAKGWQERAERAESDLATLRTVSESGCQCSDDEACAHVRRAERAEAEAAAMRRTLSKIGGMPCVVPTVCKQDAPACMPCIARSALSTDAGRSLLSEVERLRAEAAKNQREHDLVRQMRMELHSEQLITEAEYAALASEHGCVQRLEDYDAIRSQLDAQKARAEWAEANLRADKCHSCVFGQALVNESTKNEELRSRIEGLENSLHTACGSCGTPTEPDIRICPKCLDAWIGGKGCEFLDKAQVPLRAANNDLTQKRAEDGIILSALRSRIEALEAALREFRPERKDEDSENSEECQECGNTYALRDDCSASAECDVCAHDILERGRAAARALLSAPATPLADDYSTDALLSAPAQSQHPKECSCHAMEGGKLCAHCLQNMMPK